MCCWDVWLVCSRPSFLCPLLWVLSLRQWWWGCPKVSSNVLFSSHTPTLHFQLRDNAICRVVCAVKVWCNCCIVVGTRRPASIFYTRSMQMQWLGCSNSYFTSLLATCFGTIYSSSTISVSYWSIKALSYPWHVLTSQDCSSISDRERERTTDNGYGHPIME